MLPEPIAVTLQVVDALEQVTALHVGDLLERALVRLAKRLGSLRIVCGVDHPVLTLFPPFHAVLQRQTSHAKEDFMKAIVVYESHWGNTAAVARAIAEGLGAEARALSTAEATSEAIAGADLIVAGAPLLGFSLLTESMLKGLASNAGRDPTPPDLSHPSMRSWIDALPAGNARAAAFETRIWWSPGSAAKAILGKLEAAGYRPAAKAQRFVVQGKYGPLREGELEKAKAWGTELAQATK